jgi:lipase chaperone LimK
MQIKTVYLAIGATAWAAAIFFTIKLIQPEERVAPTPSAEANLFPFVKSMDGTRSDGRLTVSADDTLVVDAELRRMFDYYLAAVGEKPLYEIRAEMERELERRLKPRAAAEAKRLLARYLDYKTDLVNVEKNLQVVGTGVGAVKARMIAMQRARLRFFSANEAQAMFGTDDAHDMDSVARLDISEDKSLSEEQKKEQMAVLDAVMPDELRKERDAPLVVVKLEELVAKMRAQGASDDEVYRARAAAFTPDAAVRLADLDREEAAWKSRIATYQAEHSKLNAANVNLPESEKQVALQRLREAGFDINEQRRLAAYE